MGNTQSNEDKYKPPPIPPGSSRRAHESSESFRPISESIRRLDDKPSSSLSDCKAQSFSFKKK
jgi:hypothetical protein